MTMATTACAVSVNVAPFPERTGTRPRFELVETALEVGATRRGQVLEILGPPDGAGRVSLPMHPEPRTVWNYNEQDGSRGKVSVYSLSLFFDDKVLSGYLWFEFEDVPIDNIAPERPLKK